MSAQQVSDACAALGHPVPRNVLANLESGRRPTITVPEVLVLAGALRVSPLSLIFPLGHAEQFEVLPGKTIPTWEAVQWFTDEGAEGGGAERLTPLRLYREYAQLLASRRRAVLAAADDRRRAGNEAVGAAERDALLSAARSSEDRALALSDQLRELAWRMKNNGLALPDLDEGPVGLTSELLFGGDL